MAPKTRQSLAAPDLQFGNEPIPPSLRQKLDRLTGTVRALLTEAQKLQQMLAGGTAGQVLEKNSTGDYDAAWQAANGGTVIGADNLGPAGSHGLFVSLIAGLLGFKSLIPGDHIKLVADGTSITIAVDTAGGGGLGTVTSVGIDSADLDVTGTPVTSAGSITLTIKAKAVTYAKIQDLSQDSVVLGRRLGEGAGSVEELTVTDLNNLGLGGGGYPNQLGHAGI